MATVWGSRVWTLLHRLSFYSNRQDIKGSWKNLLRILTDTLPCSLCRNHMREYINKNPLIFPPNSSSLIIRETIILWLYKFHNHVNLSNGREIFPFDQMELKYGQGFYEEAIRDAKRLISEIDELWPGVPCREWKSALSFLCGLIMGGPL